MAFFSMKNHFLIPSETMSDERFVEALIYVCHHSPQGAWGLIVNQPIKQMYVGEVLAQLDLLEIAQQVKYKYAMHGGFVRPEAGFVLHTGLPNFDSSFAVGENVCLTTSKDVLKCLAVGELSHFLLCMGFCGWSKGQLEQEVKAADWLVCPVDTQILFGAKHEDKLNLAYQKLGMGDLNVPMISGRA